MDPKNIAINDFTYQLPPERIASAPLPSREASRLLMYGNGRIQDAAFSDLPGLLHGPATLVLNNTRVIEARIFFQKPTGGVIEVFCLEPYTHTMSEALSSAGSVTWKCLIGGASKWKAGQILRKSMEQSPTVSLEACYLGKEGDAFLISFRWDPAGLPFEQVLQLAGAMPLPPYIKRRAESADAERYQTVFSEHKGSVAAPTASLHFTTALLNALEEKHVVPAYLTLHVGAGTFKPVKADRLAGHDMHGEPFSVSRDTLARILQSEKVIAVGTTSLRTLESLYWIGLKLKHELEHPFELGQWEAYELAAGSVSYQDSYRGILDWMEQQEQSAIHCRTSLLIAPGYRIRVADALITNFHQPQSTLLLLVAAFIGEDWRKVYDHALNSGYRFLSYGDSSLLWRTTPETRGE